ncbi:MAG: T9SS type A sorting domain-containing protein, partial [Fibrobacteres bacterium]|nr:T9SS type A sorting domain-containing protein [Fibrobacterota bacterium]
QIANFGEYGNYDSRGTGSTIPMAFPTGVAVTDNYIYVTDFGNSRLVRVRMNYELENIRLPEVLADGSRVKGVTKLTSSPDPFNPVSKITLSLAASTKARLAVYSVDGRLVKNIASGLLNSGTHQFIWNAKDSRGNAVSAGMYVYRLTTERGEVFLKKTVLSK